jgi:hypothetical protein
MVLSLAVKTGRRLYFLPFDRIALKTALCLYALQFELLTFFKVSRFIVDKV